MSAYHRHRTDLWVADPAGKQTRRSILRLRDPPKAPAPDIDRSILDPTGAHRLTVVANGGVARNDTDFWGISASVVRA